MDLDGASRNLTVAALLTLSGGLPRCVHVRGHGHVFANTMTGNVALLGINVSGEWAAALHHVPPLGGFVVAVFVAHLLGLAARAAGCGIPHSRACSSRSPFSASPQAGSSARRAHG
ncbi:hypothetical protein C7S15_0013 [Burkholderia cepacia]|nr:hypothetical protein [Burkholderia cepacia]